MDSWTSDGVRHRDSDATSVGVALRQAGRHLLAPRVPLPGLEAAFVFAAEMIHFPVVGGTSSQWVGGVLVGALSGTSASVIVMSSVPIVHCLMFADGASPRWVRTSSRARPLSGVVLTPAV